MSNESDLDDWSFDFETLLLAEKNDFRIKEVPVNWKLSKGYKVKPVLDGKLDDECWFNVENINSFIQLEPNYNINPTELSEVKIIQDEFNKFTNLNNLPKLFSIEEFEYSKLLTLAFSDESYINKPQLFLDLEKYLNSKVDSRIEVFYKELIDFNKLRLKNSPQRLD